MNQFIESLGQCPNLTDLDISNNRIEDDSMKTFLQYLEQHHNLTNIDISGNIDWDYDEEYEGYEDFNAYIDSLKIRDIIKH
jgi:Leucine-rich repeat (LRR) protein